MSNLDEKKTRAELIDPLIKESGFFLDQKKDIEYEVTGMPNNEGIGFVDYVLWGDDGLPLAVVEAKRTIRNPNEGKQQAKLYADCLEKEFGRRPVIYYSNGYEHWFWDDTNYPSRPVQGFHSKDELELIMQRRTSRSSLKSEKINNEIVERSYQHEAIRKVTEAFEENNERRSLLVMATGSGG
jgi:type I restriction enzyme R subunit